jgi:flagella basal body P-ring formation protein FlgA
MKKLYLLTLFLLQTSGTGRAIAGECPFPSAGACHVLTAEEVDLALRQLILPQGAPTGEVKIEILGYTRVLVPSVPVELAPVELTRGGAPGGILVIHGQAGAVPIWARARVTMEQTVLVALEDLPLRQPIRAAQFESRPMRVPWGESALKLSEEAAVGAQPRRVIHAGEVISPALIELPFEVRRGAVVDFHVRSGAAHLRLQATALHDARRGQPVSLRAVRFDGRDQLLDAVVTGPSEAEIDTGRRAPQPAPVTTPSERGTAWR